MILSNARPFGPIIYKYEPEMNIYSVWLYVAYEMNTR